jgi:hypothetical protein
MRKKDDADIPVAIIAFNRPKHTAQLMEALSRVKPRRLFIIADGPRAHRDGEELLCSEVRDIIAKSINWDSEVFWDALDQNLGCKTRIETGLDWVFANAEKALILEDDCIPSESFFPFCSAMLSQFEHDDRVGAICGTNAVAGMGHTVPGMTDGDYLFSRYFVSFGWATWAQSWKRYDSDIAAWNKLRETRWLQHLLGSPVAAAYWSAVFNSILNGVDTWDYPWLFSLWKDGLRCIHPRVNLVSNIGFGPEATHTFQPSPLGRLVARDLEFPLVSPQSMLTNTEYDELMEDLLYSKGMSDLFDRIRRYGKGKSLSGAER